MPPECHESGQESAFPTIVTARPISECEWRPFDLVQKRSGPHNLNRSGYDEESTCCILSLVCQNVDVCG